MELSDIFKDQEQSARLKAEAEFGWREIKPFLEADREPQSVLEVGCGTGFLLAQLAQEYIDISFSGVEPIGSGFSQFESSLDAIEARYKNISVIRKRIEDIKSDEKYDLIYSVNVFEHLDDWCQAIDICVSMLKTKGQLVILCPNYWIPYESHFSLPIIGTKSLTYKIFSRKILEKEAAYDAHGIWASLNFVTAPQIQRYCSSKGYKLDFDKAIMGRMLDRLDEDPLFKERQSSLARLGSLANRFGAGALFRALPPRCSAYMKAVIQA